MNTDDLFSRAEALAKQRAEILKWADEALGPKGFGSPRKLRRSARNCEALIVGIGEIAVLRAALGMPESQNDSPKGGR